MKSNPISPELNPMEKKRIMYFDLIEDIDQYIDQVGITKACADIMTVLANRLNDKLRIVGPALEKEEHESHLSQTPSDTYPVRTGTCGRSIKESQSHKV